MSPQRWIITPILISVLLLTACSIAPKQIAFFTMTTPIARFPLDSTIVYREYLELKVTDVDEAADNAKRMASNYNGYLVNSQSWDVDELKVTILELAVPSIYFESFSTCFLGLSHHLWVFHGYSDMDSGSCGTFLPHIPGRFLIGKTIPRKERIRSFVERESRFGVIANGVR